VIISVPNVRFSKPSTPPTAKRAKKKGGIRFSKMNLKKLRISGWGFRTATPTCPSEQDLSLRRLKRTDRASPRPNSTTRVKENSKIKEQNVKLSEFGSCGQFKIQNLNEAISFIHSLTLPLVPPTCSEPVESIKGGKV